MTYSERWTERINGERYHIWVKSGRIFNYVKIRDGKWIHRDNTIKHTIRPRWFRPSLEKQVEKTLERAVEQRQGVHRAKERVKERASVVSEAYDEF